MISLVMPAYDDFSHTGAGMHMADERKFLYGGR